MILFDKIKKLFIKPELVKSPTQKVQVGDSYKIWGETREVYRIDNFHVLYCTVYLFRRHAGTDYWAKITPQGLEEVGLKVLSEESIVDRILTKYSNEAPC